ncbi:ATP-dependent DNA helicase DinG [Rheinheimera salexigens]|uniref:Damage-inducible protein n=1 Tax=Rheinheimera salexigens TaxID=1628148 RepID=A0A1E7Q952_9GAMM|nr:ATP-dependent DNA helicase DinG [Rheinheimera salexigens]OEY70548.1 damage-inducible protein [Rheinheimera salexigens]
MLSEQLKIHIRRIHQSIKTGMPNYQPRPAQNKLIAEIANIIAGQYHRQERIGLIEAGTGTGKSLAYLLASIPYALQHKKTVVIATATVALQEQLITKDLPFFQLHSKLAFDYSLVKGRQRYACIERLKQQIKHPELFAKGKSNNSSAPEVAPWQQLLQQWQQRQWLGDKDSLSITIPEPQWADINADAMHCSSSNRAHINCPFHLARAEADTAQVLVVNHALLLADLANGNAILPPPEDCIYIIDEGHHLAETARDFFAANAPISHNNVWLDKAGKTIQQLIALLPETEIKSLLRLDDSCNELSALLKTIERVATPFKSSWFEGKPLYRFTEAALPKLIQQQAEELARVSSKAKSQLEKVQQLVPEHITSNQLALKPRLTLLQELSFLGLQLEQQQALWQLYAVQPSSKSNTVNQARWVALAEHSDKLIAHACPLAVGNKLAQLLFAEAYAVIVCSATLTALNSFNYIKFDLGLHDFEGVKIVQVASPFAYAEKGIIIIPKMQTEPTVAEFTAELISQLPHYLPQQQASLVLFASYWQMQQVATALREQGFSLLVQGEASRQALLQLHGSNCQHNKTSILFGTQSFSEGLDLPGNLLTNLVITKLPFAVPTSPLEEALAEAISKKGGNAFTQLAIPATAKKLVQACGRLLRQEQDQGRIIIFDRRLVNKSYGSAMLNALPPFRRQIEY